MALLVLALATACAAQESTSSAPSADASVPAEASIDAPPTELPPTPSAMSGGLVAQPYGSEAAPPLGYLEYLPPGYGDGEQRPLLVFFHGAGADGDGSVEDLELVDVLGIPQLIAQGDWPDDRPFVVLAPQYGTGPASGKCGIGEDIAAFLEFALATYDVDPSRVYLTGISCGAIGVWDYLASYGDAGAVAAAVLIVGHPMWAIEKGGCAPLARVPTWAFQAAQDDIIPVSFAEEQIDLIRNCDSDEPAEIELTIYPDADHAEGINPTYDLSAGHDIYAWLLEHEGH